MFFQRNRCKTVAKKGWHTEPSLSQSDGRTKPRHHLPKSPFFSLFRCFLPAVAGKCWKPSPKPMALLIPASKFILSENTVISLRNRTKANLRQRDLSRALRWHTSVFLFIMEIVLIHRKKGQTADKAVVGRSMQQCSFVYTYNVAICIKKSLSEVDNISPIRNGYEIFTHLQVERVKGVC